MPPATKNDLMNLRGPEPICETTTLPGFELTVTIRGLVRSAARSAVYREIDEMANVRDVLVDGVRVQVTEDDITAACWAAECVTSPKLTAFEWLTFGARNTDLLTFVGIRCLICSRLIADDSLAEGVSAAETELLEGRDPLACTLSDFASPG